MNATSHQLKEDVGPSLALMERVLRDGAPLADEYPLGGPDEAQSKQIPTMPGALLVVLLGLIVLTARRTTRVA